MQNFVPAVGKRLKKPKGAKAAQGKSEPEIKASAPTAKVEAKDR